MQTTDAQILESFLNSFQLLTPKQKRIWNYLKSLAKTYRNVFPSHAAISKACGCHRDTVIQAVKIFKSLNWIDVIKRSYSSCVYHIKEFLVEVDIRNPKTFLQKKFAKKNDNNPTTKPTQINKNKYDSNMNDNEVQEPRSVQNQEIKKDHASLEGFNFNQKDTVILQALTKKNPEAMEKAIFDFQQFSQKEQIKNPAAFLTSRWKFYKSPGHEDEAPEIANLPVSEKDKKILSKYNHRDRKSFLLAYEDFKTYKVVRKVGNVAAFITSRFFAYLKGEGSVKKIPLPMENKRKAQHLEKTSNFPVGVQLCLLNNYLEINQGTFCDTLEYTHPNFDKEIRRLFKKWKGCVK